MRDFTHLLTQIHAHSFINDRDQQDDTGTFGSDISTKTKDNQTLIFRHNLDGVEQEYRKQKYYRPKCAQCSWTKKLTHIIFSFLIT
jgi:hypothetical protein